MTAVYLYCIVKSSRKPSAAKAPEGLPGATHPEILPLSGALWIVIADVPLDTYGAGRLDEHLADMDWVGRIALAHEDVVEHFARKAGATVIPMKLFTMFSTRDRAVEDVRSRRRTIDASMRRISGAEEWGVRIVRGERAPMARSRAKERAASGAAFLAAKKQARDDARSARIAGAEAALTTFERLSKHARDSRRRDDTPAAGATPPLLDAAFLVAAPKKAAFIETARREAAACARAGAHMTLSGPWPAYNFVQGAEEPR